MSDITCPSCGKTFDSADKGACPHCGAPAGAAPPTVDIPPPDSAAPSTEELPLPDGMSAAFGETPRVGAPVTPDTPADKKSFSRYQILGELGRGGMGIVYKTYDPKLKRIVALKVLLAGDAASGEEVERFFREAESAASLHHPNIVPIHELDVHEGKHFFTMDYIEGKPLSKVIRETDTGMKPRRAVEIVRDVARAVQHAHEGGIIHRDLKPANILIKPDGHPMVTDFGLAKQVKGDSDLTKSGDIMGTPAYMAPEQARGRIKEIDARTDVYSLGAVLYEAVTGLPPFMGATPFEIMEKVAYADPIPPRTFNRACPPDVETIALKCLEKERSRRYASAADLADDCERFLNNDPIAARPASVIYRLRKRLARHKAVATVLTLAVAAVFGLTAWYVTSLRHSLKETKRERDRAVEAEKQEAEQRRLAEEKQEEAEAAQRQASQEKQKRAEAERLVLEERRKEEREWKLVKSWRFNEEPELLGWLGFPSRQPLRPACKRLSAEGKAKPALCIQSWRGMAVGSADEFIGNVRLDFEACVIPPYRCSVGVFIGSDEKGSERYRALFGGIGRKNLLTRGGGLDVVTATPAVKIKPGTWHRYSLRRRGSVISAYMDGEKLLEYNDLAPLSRFEHGNVGFETRLGHVHFAEAEVYRLTVPLKMTPLAIAESFAEKGLVDDAIESYGEFASDNPDAAVSRLALFRAGLLLMSQHKYVEAVEIFRRLEAQKLQDETSMWAASKAAQCDALVGKDVAMDEKLLALYLTDPFSPVANDIVSYYRREALSHLSKNRTVEAERAVAFLLDSFPGKEVAFSDVQLTLGKQLLSEKRRREAVDILTKLGYSNNASPDVALQALEELRGVYVKEHNWGACLSICRRMLNIDPENYSANMHLGSHYFNNRGYANAIFHYERVIKRPLEAGCEHVIQDRLPISYVYQGFRQFEQGNHAEAESALRRVVELRPDWPYGVYLLFSVLVLVEKQEEVAELASAFLARRGDKVKPWQRALFEYFAGTRTAESLLGFAEVLEEKLTGLTTKQKLCEAYFYVGVVKIGGKELKAGLDLLEKCVATRCTDYMEYKYAKMCQRLALRQYPFVKEWNIVGPLDLGLGDARAAKRLDNGKYLALPMLAMDGELAPEIKVDLTATYEGKGGKKIAWRTVRAEDSGLVNIEMVYHDDYAAACAVAYVHSPTAGTFTMSVGSDDGVVVRINGKQIWRNHTCRGAIPDQDVFSAELHEGWNEVLLKVVDRSHGWGFYFRIHDPDRALRFSLLPGQAPPETSKPVDEAKPEGADEQF